MVTLYKGFTIECVTHGRADDATRPHYTEVLIDGLGELRLDFAAPIYGLELAKLAVELRLRSAMHHGQERLVG